MTDGPSINPIAQLAKYGPTGIVLGVFLLAFTWGGKVVIERLMKHFDTVEIVLKESAQSGASTARSIENIVIQGAKVQESIDKLPDRIRQRKGTQ